MGMTAIYAAHPNIKSPGDAGMVALKKLLDDIPDDIFKRACEIVARSNEAPWALVAAIERAAARVMGFLDSSEAYDLLDSLMDNFYMPGLGSTSYQVICDKLRERSQERLIPYFNQFGVEIYNRENITASRAQFRRAYDAMMQNEIKNFLIEEPKRRQRLEARKKAIPARIETIKPEDWQSLKDMLPKIESLNGNGQS